MARSGRSAGVLGPDGPVPGGRAAARAPAGHPGAGPGQLRHLRVFRWELEELAGRQLADLPQHVRRELAVFMDAVVLVDPTEYQRAPGETRKPLRTLYFGPGQRA